MRTCSSPSPLPPATISSTRAPPIPRSYPNALPFLPRKGDRNVSMRSVTGGSSTVSDPDDRRRKTIGGLEDPLEFDFLELKREAEKEEEEGTAVPEVEEDGRIERRKVLERGGRQMMKRSSLLAKQVISMQSASSMGFVSQIWVDTSSWMVVVVEVRPSILSGENDKFLLDDIYQVGDVVLVHDESVIENELRMIGLDTLVGYDVVTSGRRTVGKVRGYNFNINSGAIESLELDSFGVSILPSSLVSTFSLLIEDIVDVVQDKVVVQDDALSRIQRLTKGFWGSKSVASSEEDIEEYTDFRRPRRHEDGYGRRKTRSKSRDYPSRTRGIDDDDWDLPMEY